MIVTTGAQHPTFNIIKMFEGLGGSTPSSNDIINDNSFHLHKFVTYGSLKKPHQQSSPLARFIRNGFSTSPDDPNTFLTSCNDGIARLYDIRESLPRISFDCGMGNDVLLSALYVHVDGKPLVITGGQN
ncbi:hypothetical protein EUX98_g18 [Antrodiella citrinella]|uniref:DUF2415 domain-containing protein n=1 Tax=Antrodiella citrinella TaxID=2447956 RepID=A0A4V3XJS5_9APHY|nr:hypothetical protein EUX98_g18 [Antrodiella citrinella]